MHVRQTLKVIPSENWTRVKEDGNIKDKFWGLSLWKLDSMSLSDSSKARGDSGMER